MFEFFIAKRYLRSKHKLNFITIISLLSTAGITIGVAALIIVLSVFNGFSSLVQSILINIDPHLRVSVISDDGFEELNDLKSEFGKINGLVHATQFVEGKTILYNESSFEILTLKGIEDSAKSGWGLGDKLIDGELDFSREGRYDKIVLGIPMALRLSLRVGDTVTVTSTSKIEKAITQLVIPNTKRFILSGVFESNNRDFDLHYAFCSIKAAQSLLGMGKKISGYEFQLSSPERSEEAKEQLLSGKVGSGLKIETWYDLHSELYGMMMVERWAAYILLALIIAVATFNILGSLTMSVVEKKKDIGVLRSMGANDQSILRIFMFEGVLVGILGTIFGAILGLGICYIQMEFNIYPLDPTKYIIDSLPMEVRFSDTMIIMGTSLFLASVASLYPAKKAVKNSLIEAIKWE
ncbi:MAG: ABC transporter permease [Bacteroidetes bacterium]|nr:ABC transporter permease [Bacteroidota bacterium]